MHRYGKDSVDNALGNRDLDREGGATKLSGAPVTFLTVDGQMVAPAIESAAMQTGSEAQSETYNLLPCRLRVGCGIAFDASTATGLDST